MLEFRRSRESGQAALFITMTLTVTFGVMGLVVDEGWAYYRQEACVTAAQAAALAGAVYANNNNTTWPPSSCSATTALSCSSTAYTCPSNLTLGTSSTSVYMTACLYAQQNGFKATGNQNVMIYANSGNSGISGATTAYYVTAKVSEKTPLTFLSVLTGQTSTIVSGTSTSGIITTPASDCVYVLDPSGSASLNASNGVTIQSECGYWINSSSSSALSVIGGATVKALDSSSINLVGGVNQNNGGVISPTPTKTSAAADPFGSIPVPLQRAATGSHSYSCTYGSSGGCAHTSTATYQCDYNSFNWTSWVSNLNMSPGVYCGGIQIGNVSQVTFAPGVYILDGGGMNLGGSGGINKVIASGGVSFFDTGTSSTYRGITVGNGVPFTVSAESSGSQAGIVMFQDPSLTLTNGTTNTTSYFNGGTNLNITGSLYFPTTTLNYSNGSTSAAPTGLVVYDVVFTGGTYFKKDTTDATGLGSSQKLAMVQ